MGHAHLTRIGDPYGPEVKRLIDRFPISILKEIRQDCHVQTGKWGLTFRFTVRRWLEVAEMSVDMSVSHQNVEWMEWLVLWTECVRNDWLTWRGCWLRTRAGTPGSWAVCLRRCLSAARAHTPVTRAYTRACCSSVHPAGMRHIKGSATAPLRFTPC